MATSDIKKGPLYVDSTNNRVGVGTASPDFKVEIVGGTNNGLHIKDAESATVFGGLFTQSANLALVARSNHALTLGTNDAERLRIDSSGNVGIGTSSPDTSPSTKLHIREDDAVDYKSRAVVQAQDQRLVAGSHYQFGVTAYSYLQATNDAETVPNNLSLNPDGGNVGIGTTNPNSGKLHVSHTTGTIGYFESTQAAANVSNVVLNATQTNSSANATFQINHGTTAQAQLRLNGDSSFAIHNKAGLAESLRITSGGNVCLGTTSLNGLGGLSYSNADEYLFFNRTTSSGTYIYFRQNGTQTGYISHNATTTSYSTTSDYRLKTAVAYDWDATSRLKQLKPARFEWIADGDDAVPVDGFLAHEVADIVPEAITGTKDAVDEDGNPVMQGIDQSKLVPLLCKTILELEARITALEAN